jgi:hypothetical protein
MRVIMKHGEHIQKLTALAKARWAFQLADGGAVTDAHLEHTGAARNDLDALVQGLIDSGDLVRLELVGSTTCRVTPRHQPSKTLQKSYA